MSNLSKEKRDEMIDYLHHLKEIHTDDESIIALEKIETALTEKKYGLIWEEHEEEVDKKLVHNIPVFKEIEERKIVADESNDFNFLLEGDNLHSLKLLEKTHKGKIDVIYIDPPYNTGNKDFIYDDDYVGTDDGYRHSKWLSFMSERLKIAKELLSDEGVIVISIDDNELFQLKILCDGIFGEKQFIANLPTVMNFKGNQAQLGFAGTHEYTLVYCNNIFKVSFNEFNLENEEIENKWLEDSLGYYKKGATLKRTGNDAPRYKRPTTFYPILLKNNKISSISNDEYLNIYNRTSKKFDDEYLNILRKKYENQDFEFVLPTINGEYASWRWSIDTLNKNLDEIIIIRKDNNIGFYKKQRPELGDVPTRKPKTLFYKPSYSTGSGTNELKKILGNKEFENPKAVDLIKDFINITSKSNSTILDYFAGSGTTGHAVMELNKEDGGKRKFILCTNNENGIAEDVCYKRIKKVIRGYKYTSKNKEIIVEGNPHNLKYYKTDFIPKLSEDEDILSSKLLDYIKEMVELENMCEIDGNVRRIILSNDDLKVALSEMKEGSTLYIPSFILVTNEIKEKIDTKGLDIITIPDYYFADELREVNEL